MNFYLSSSEILSYYAHLAVLVVVPSIVEEIYVLEFSEGSQIIVMCCVYLRLLNSFNMVVLFLYRQKDFRYDAVQYFKCIFCRQKHLVKPTIVVCFEKWTEQIKSFFYFEEMVLLPFRFRSKNNSARLWSYLQVFNEKKKHIFVMKFSKLRVIIVISGRFPL